MNPPSPWGSRSPHSDPVRQQKAVETIMLRLPLRLRTGTQLVRPLARAQATILYRNLQSSPIRLANQDPPTKQGPSSQHPQKPQEEGGETLNSSRYSPEHSNPNHSTTHKTPTDEIIETIRPYLDSAHRFYTTSKQQLSSLTDSLKLHYGKAKAAVQIANEKYEQQEKESASFNFKEDFTSDSQASKKVIQGLPSERERNRKRWAKKLEFYIDSLQETIFTATRALNDVTGYSAIQKLRESIDALERELEHAKKEVRSTKEKYNEAIANRLQTQKEVNELLQRKASWSPTDLERFTKLYKEDHSNALHEEQSKNRMEQAELHQEELYDKLSNAILTRYHEEQIWSDKIRRTSTWGTFGLMGINIFLFLIFQLALEPWKRRRLVGSFEDKVQAVLEENTHKQNEKLDLMREKMEELKNNEHLPALEESVEPEVINDVYFVSAPRVQELPLVTSENWKAKLLAAGNLLIQPLKAPYQLLFHAGYQSTVLTKTDLISTVSLTLALGAILGSLLSSLLR